MTDGLLEGAPRSDLVITADIPLASDVISRGAHSIDPRGELYTEDTIRERLSKCDALTGIPLA